MEKPSDEDSIIRCADIIIKSLPGAGAKLATGLVYRKHYRGHEGYLIIDVLGCCISVGILAHGKMGRITMDYKNFRMVTAHFDTFYMNIPKTRRMIEQLKREIVKTIYGKNR